MYAANLSWNQLHREFGKLLASELIEKIDISYDPKTRRGDKRSKYKYEITPKGRNLVKYFTRDAVHLEPIINTMYT
jgi:predicted transcriptional regulator